jgi:membrane-anchored mycosin MYCP
MRRAALRSASAGLLVMALSGLAVVTTFVSAPPAAAACATRDQAGTAIHPTPWPQRMLDPARTWPFSIGEGVTVAVIDTGTDPSHPQLAGAVQHGYDAVTRKPAGDRPCAAHGTALASLIAGRGEPGIGFRGLAPGASILPVRVADQEIEDDQLDQPSISPRRVADGITWAADHGADVICVGATLYSDNADLRAAVRHAEARDAVLVAPVGDHPTGTQPHDPVPYPAAYAGVVGVGGIDATGARTDGSQVGDSVDLVAPGGNMVGAALGSGYQVYSGSPLAAAFVAAIAALVRSAAPSMGATEVADRLMATASPSLAGGQSAAYGAGVVDPYRAVTELEPHGRPATVRPLRPVSSNPATAARRVRAEEIAAAVASACGLLTVVVLVGAVCRPIGRRRRWRPGRWTPPDPGSMDDEIADSVVASSTTDEVFAPPQARARSS